MLSSLRKSLGVKPKTTQVDSSNGIDSFVYANQVNSTNSFGKQKVQNYVQQKLGTSDAELDDPEKILNIFLEYIMSEKGLKNLLKPELKEIQNRLLALVFRHCLHDKDNYSISFMQKMIKHKNKPSQQLQAIIEEAEVNQQFRNDLFEGFFVATDRIVSA
jgi:hypothetical protein